MSDEPSALDQLKAMLVHIERHDTDHERRYGMVLRAVAKAHTLGLVAGIRSDPQEPEWPVAFIELPTGQVSWHLPQHPNAWDGHTTEEKYKRIRDWFFND
jgi:hypothetical protein